MILHIFFFFTTWFAVGKYFVLYGESCFCSIRWIYTLSQSRVWTVPSLYSWKFWKFWDDFGPDAIEINCPSGSKSSQIFQNFHEYRDGTVHTLDGTVYDLKTSWSFCIEWGHLSSWQANCAILSLTLIPNLLQLWPFRLRKDFQQLRFEGIATSTEHWIGTQVTENQWRATNDDQLHLLRRLWNRHLRNSNLWNALVCKNLPC